MNIQEKLTVLAQIDLAMRYVRSGDPDPMVANREKLIKELWRLYESSVGPEKPTTST